MIRAAGILSRPPKGAICDALPPLAEWLKARGIRVILDEESARSCGVREEAMPRERIAEVADLLIVLGGDGTLLAAARVLAERDVPILGVNLGGLGFLTSVPRDAMYPLLEQVLAGQYHTSERMMLEARVLRATEAPQVIARQLALNDAVINQAALARLMDFNVSVGGAFVGRYRADGLVVATPTGSTAYSLAAGGPILQPGLAAFVITPICPHMLTNRPLVIPDSSQVDIDFVADGSPVHLTLDGQVGIKLGPGDRISISKSPRTVRLIIPPGQSYFDVLRSKLRWSQR
jgi:NAD+ kinase